jgi:hypothetical protein
VAVGVAVVERYGARRRWKCHTPRIQQSKASRLPALLRERAAIQLFVSAPHVRELAEGLTRLAEYLESAKAADSSQGPAT